MVAKREYGAEQPYSAGPLMLRLPFIHYRIEYQDFIQGIILCCVPLGITAAMTNVLGIPIEIAVLMVVINNFLYLLHLSFGDPSVSGWITAGIPLYISYLVGYSEGPERIKALIALQVLVGLIFIFLGISGVVKKVISHFPISMRAGIILGAGLSALQKILDPKEPYVSNMPISFGISGLLSFFILFSRRGMAYREKNGLLRWIASYGIAPGFVIGYAIGLVTGEISPPTGVFDQLIISMPAGEMLQNFSLIGLGFPTTAMWVSAISLAIVAYVLAFGDIIVLESLIAEADSARKDEKIPYRSVRNHVITGIRNVGEGICTPFLPLCGPQWTAAQAVVLNRYKYSTPKEEPSYWGGASSFFWGMSLAMVFHPIVQIIMPAISIGFGLTLLIQGYLCSYIAFSICQTNLQRGIAGIMAASLITSNYIELWDSPFWSGPTIALIIGTILFFTLEYYPEKNGQSSEG